MSPRKEESPILTIDVRATDTSEKGDVVHNELSVIDTGGSGYGANSVMIGAVPEAVKRALQSLQNAVRGEQIKELSITVVVTER